MNAHGIMKDVERHPSGLAAPAASLMPDQFLRLPEVMAVVGVSRTTIYRWVSEGVFVRPCKLSRRVVAWRASELAQWIEARQHAR